MARFAPRSRRRLEGGGVSSLAHDSRLFHTARKHVIADSDDSCQGHQSRLRHRLPPLSLSDDEISPIQRRDDIPVVSLLSDDEIATVQCDGNVLVVSLSSDDDVVLAPGRKVKWLCFFVEKNKFHYCLLALSSF